MRVRDARPGDYPAIVEIINHAIVGSVVTFDLEPVTVEQRLPWFQAFGSQHPLLVCEGADGVVLGYAYYLPYRSKAAYASTKEVSVYVSEHCRRRRVATQLYEVLIERARSAGVHALVAVLGGDNGPSRRLHDNFGFRHVGDLREVGHKFGAWVDTHYYERILE